MDLDDFIIAVSCAVGEAVREVTGGQRLRQRGPRPKLAESEVLTMEVVGESLGLAHHRALLASSQRHSAHFSPALRTPHRTTFVRQAANRWRLEERLWRHMVRQVPPEPRVALMVRFPLPACPFARAHRGRRFRGEAAFGKDTLLRQPFSGFRVHVRLEWPGVIVRCCLAPANVHELTALSALAEQIVGTLVGDRNYSSPPTTAEWQRLGVDLLAPHRSAKRDPHPRWSAGLNRVRYRIDTVFGQLVDRGEVKRVWARDLWHFSNRVLRNVLMHTVAVLLNVEPGNPPLHLTRLVA